jgi:hypothetical protein
MADLSLLQGFSLLSSQFPCSMFSHTDSFLGADSICMHHTSMFCVCPPPTLFPTAFPSRVFLFSFLMCTRMCYLFGGLLVSCYFLSSSRTIGFSLTSLPDAPKKLAKLIFRDQNYVSSAIHFVCVYTPCLCARYTVVSDLEGSDNGDPLYRII